MTDNSFAQNASFLNPSIEQYNAILRMEVQKAEKVNSFKERIAPFKTVATLREAKDLAAKILPTANEVNMFYVGDAKCIVINKEEMLRISIDTTNEFFCYDFS